MNFQSRSSWEMKPVAFLKEAALSCQFQADLSDSATSGDYMVPDWTRGIFELLNSRAVAVIVPPTVSSGQWTYISLTTGKISGGVRKCWYNPILYPGFRGHSQIDDISPIFESLVCNSPRNFCYPWRSGVTVWSPVVDKAAHSSSPSLLLDYPDNDNLYRHQIP